MQWIRLAIVLTTFITSCIGLGYFARLVVQQRKWSRFVLGVFTGVIAFIWPIIMLVAEYYRGNEYIRQHPNEVNDAPAMVWVSMLFIGAPIVFIVSLLLAVVGVSLARLKRPLE